jgi:hypothetical protein
MPLRRRPHDVAEVDKECSERGVNRAIFLALQTGASYFSSLPLIVLAEPDRYVLHRGAPWSFRCLRPLAIELLCILRFIRLIAVCGGAGALA